VTGVARSDYANRVFAQGALASYILGQFVVDQTAQDADLNESVFYTNFKNALVNYIKANSVTLNTAQTVGGVKTFSLSPLVPTATAGDNSTKAASTAFVKKAIDDHTNAIKPVSYGEQTLTDAEKAQARTNIGAPDASDAVTISTNQTITGKKTITQTLVASAIGMSRDSLTSHLRFSGGTGAFDTGGHLDLFGAANGTDAGAFLLGAADGINRKQMRGAPDGTLTWDGNPVLTSDSGVTIDTTQTITGAKEFTVSPEVPDLTTGDSTQKAANSAFVQQELSTLGDALQQNIDAIRDEIRTVCNDIAGI
jgi:hypothetical protein